MYLTLVLFNALATAVYLVLSSKVMKESGLSPNATIAAVHLSAGVILLIPALVLPGPLLPLAGTFAVTWLIITSGLKLLSKKFAFFAYARTDVANVSAFSAFIPIFGMVFGLTMLGETIGRLELAGTIIVCVSVYLLFLKKREPGAATTGPGCCRLFSRCDRCRFSARSSPPFPSRFPRSP